MKIFIKNKIEWWCYTCAILGNDVFEGQKHHFSENNLLYASSASNTLKYLKNNYEKTGNPIYLNLKSKFIMSIITLEYYDIFDNLLELKDHFSPDGILCNNKTIFSKKEALLLNTCCWCGQFNINFENKNMIFNNILIQTQFKNAIGV
jgi:hypothetical protein